MVIQIKNAKLFLQAKLGQRGAEMVEYAIVLACIAAVAVLFYSSGDDATATNSLKSVLETLWKNVTTAVGKAG